jgi:hypothetical protein
MDYPRWMHGRKPDGIDSLIVKSDAEYAALYERGYRDNITEAGEIRPETVERKRGRPRKDT